MKFTIPRWFLRDIIAPFFATRLLLCFVGWWALAWADPPNWEGWEIRASGFGGPIGYNTHAQYLRSPGLALVNMWARWDTGWYMSIALDGYEFKPGEQCNTGFFPLYPMLMRWIAKPNWRMDQRAIVVAGILISNVSLITALALLHKLIRLDHDEKIASRAMLYALVLPMTIFFSAVYTESIFLLTTIAAFYFARRGKWWIAGLFGAFAGISRVQGFLLTCGLAVEYWQQRRKRVDASAVLFPGLAFSAHVCALRYWFGTWLVLPISQSAWERHFVLPWHTIGTHTEILGAFFLIAVCTACWFWTRRSYAVFANVIFWFNMCVKPLCSIGRYGFALFPVYIVLARALRGRVVEWICVLGGLAFSCFCMARFALWYWVH